MNSLSNDNHQRQKNVAFALDPDKSALYPLLIPFIDLDGAKMKEMLTAVLRVK